MGPALSSWLLQMEVLVQWLQQATQREHATTGYSKQQREHLLQASASNTAGANNRLQQATQPEHTTGSREQHRGACYWLEQHKGSMLLAPAGNTGRACYWLQQVTLQQATQPDYTRGSSKQHRGSMLLQAPASNTARAHYRLQQAKQPEPTTGSSKQHRGSMPLAPASNTEGACYYRL